MQAPKEFPLRSVNRAFVMIDVLERAAQAAHGGAAWPREPGDERAPGLAERSRRPHWLASRRWAGVAVLVCCLTLATWIA